MNVYQLMHAFEKAGQEGPLSAHATSLYFILMIQANRNFWRGPLRLTWRSLCKQLRISTETLSKAIEELKERNLITYTPSKKGALFWFPEPSEQPDQFTSTSQNSTSCDPGLGQYVSAGETQYASVGETQYASVGETPCFGSRNTQGPIYIRQEENIERQERKRQEILNSTNTNAQSLYKATVCDQSSSSFSSSNFISFKEQHADIYRLLNEQMQIIITNWEAVVGTPWQFEWFEALKEALAICYPSQINRGIVAFAQSSPEKLKQAGFPYLMPAIRNGAFGKRNQTASRRDSDGEYWKDSRELNREKDWLDELMESTIRETKEIARRYAKLYGYEFSSEFDTDDLPEEDF